MVEVMISVVLLSVFSLAAMLVVTSGTATSADNRARVTASGLAQRELDYASEVITSSPDGAKLLLIPSTVVNAHVPPDMANPDITSDYGFIVDGQFYRVVREAVPYPIGVNSLCTNPGAAGGSGALQAYGTLVTVTVTWDGMSTATGPHVASKVFPPQRGAATGLDPGQSELVVAVEGRDKAGPAGPVQGVKVLVTGPNVITPEQSTNIGGCAVFLVKPDTAGSDYTVELRGYQGGSAYVWKDNQVSPVEKATVLPDESVQFVFNDYSRAARLTLIMSGAPEGLIIDAVPLDPAGVTKSAFVAGGQAQFTGLAPGEYNIVVGLTLKATITLSPGAHVVEPVTL
jgi:type II secretory pathway pseudopilin PulG